MSKKELRKEYKQNKKALKEKYKNQKKEQKQEYITNLIKIVNIKKEIMNPPYRSIIDEIGNAISHGVGSLFGVLALVLMILKSNSALEYVGAIIYGVGLILLFLMSAMYHAFPYGTKVKRIFRRFDYSSIYLLIGATYTPILLNYIGGTIGIIFSSIQWAIIILGITFICIFGPGKIKFYHFTMYILLGWCGILFLKDMYLNDFYFLVCILGGGVVYSLGIIPFALNKKASHFIWHLFVLVGAIVQWFGIYLYIFL